MTIKWGNVVLTTVAGIVAIVGFALVGLVVFKEPAVSTVVAGVILVIAAKAILDGIED